MAGSMKIASSVEVAERRGSVLRATATRGDNFRGELDGGRISIGSLKPILTNDTRPISTSSVSPLSASTYKPEWAEPEEHLRPSMALENDHWQTPGDLRDMLRMGKTQELKRVFRPFSLVSFGCLSLCTWEYMLLNNNQALRAGGPALLFWSYVWSFIGSLLVTASLAEMCSMAPTSGGQYHWVSEFASKRCQQFLSYITGWMTVISWQCGNATGVLMSGSLIQSIITLYRPENGEVAWQTIVFIIPCVIFVIMVNIYGGRTIAITQNIAFIGHLLALVAVVVIMAILSPHIPASRALLEFENREWPSTALAALAGQANAVFALTYSDSPVHMAEEVQDAAIEVPKALMRSILISGICGLIAVTTFVFCVPYVPDAINHSTGYSFLYVMQLSVPNGVTVAILIMFIWLVGTSAVGFAAATARITFAFARDEGLPFSKWIGKITKGVPMNAVFLTAAISTLLSLIYLGSMTAFAGIVNLSESAQTLSYILSLSSLLYRRLHSPRDLPPARWSLGPRFGPLINILALLFSINNFIWSFAPPTLPIKSTNFNISAALFGVVAVVMGVSYLVGGRRRYKGPVMGTRDTPGWNLERFERGLNMEFLTTVEE